MILGSDWLPALRVLFCLATWTFSGVWAYDNNRNDNLAVYWGQDSSGHQQNLSYYCQDDVYNVIPLAFLYMFFGDGGEPQMSFANTCNEQNGTFPGTDLSNCTFMEVDIEYCQSKGKMVTLSLGGAASSVGFVNESQAEDFADTIWNYFLGGESDIRPFGNAILDGIDLDIEGGLPTYYNNFVDKLQTYTDSADKTYIYTAAPQCPFPDAYSGPAINESKFDAIYVQFYNNYCGLNYPQQFDFYLWDNWALTQSPNPDVKIYIGAPGSAAAAGQGYVNPSVLKEYALNAQSNYSTFGGVMLWDASDAYENNRYDKAIKEAMAVNGADVTNGGSVPDSSDGGDSGQGQAECVQTEFATLDRRGMLEVFSRDGLSGIMDESLKAIGTLPTILRRHAGHISAVLSSSATSGPSRQIRPQRRKYRLYPRFDL